MNWLLNLNYSSFLSRSKLTIKKLLFSLTISNFTFESNILIFNDISFVNKFKKKWWFSSIVSSKKWRRTNSSKHWINWNIKFSSIKLIWTSNDVVTTTKWIYVNMTNNSLKRFQNIKTFIFKNVIKKYVHFDLMFWQKCLQKCLQKCMQKCSIFTFR